MNVFVLLVALAMAAITFAIEAIVAFSYWHWFLAPLLPSLKVTFLHLFAVNGILSLFCRHIQRVDDKRDSLTQAKELLIFTFIAPLGVWLIGFLIYKFQ